MVYEKLTKVFYKKGEEYFHDELQKRLSSYGSYQTQMTVRGFRKGNLLHDNYPLFYVNTHELMSLNNLVLKNSSNITTLISKLPSYIIEPYFQKLIINEAHSNNEIEGVRSTKKELKEALDKIKKSEPRYKRFKGLMKTYLYVDQMKPFEDISDFRDLYDQLVAEEIEKEDAPDGELFRKGYVEVNDGTSTTHIGISSEMKIIDELNTLIKYLYNQEHPELYRYMLAHYYYEYIHPFYDGNGRTGRLFVCSYLSRYLDRYSAITFSYAVNKNKPKYYKALEEIPSPLNKGEATFYLIDMLELLASGQGAIIEDLELNLAKLDRIQSFFKTQPWSDREEASQLLALMTSMQVFVDEDTVLSVQELMDITNKTRYKVNKILEELEQENFLQQVSQRPKAYKVADVFIEKILVG